MIKYKKVININKRAKGILSKTERQLESSRREGIKSSILHLSEFRFKKGHISSNKGTKLSEATKEKIRKNPNIRSFGFEGKHHTEKVKIKLSMMKTGRPGNPKSREHLIKMLIFNHPMRNPESLKKLSESRSLKLPKEILERIIKEFNEGKSITQLAKEIKVDRIALTKLMKKNSVIFDVTERNRLNGKTNSKVRLNQFREGHKPIYSFKKGNIPWNKKIQLEVKNNEESNITAVPFNPTTALD